VSAQPVNAGNIANRRRKTRLRGGAFRERIMGRYGYWS
jgi:hypothetical protein